MDRKRPPSTMSMKNISEGSGHILNKFNVNHHWVRGLAAPGFETICIKIVVSMATYSSYRLTMGKTKTSSYLKPQGSELLYFV